MDDRPPKATSLGANTDQAAQTLKRYLKTLLLLAIISSLLSAVPTQAAQPAPPAVPAAVRQPSPWNQDGAEPNTVWQVEVVASLGDVGRYTSLTLDNLPGGAGAGRPHISYFDATNADLRYTYYDGASWQDQIVDEIGDVGRFNSLALDDAGQPHISYCLYDPTLLTCDDLKYAWRDGALSSGTGSWHVETVDSGGSVGYDTSLALDTAGYPHISYYDPANGSLKYAYHDGNNWQLETVDSAGDAGGHTSLALDDAGHPHISYCEWTLGDLKYAHYDGASWQIETVDAPGYVGQHTSLALDDAGHPHISYEDFLFGDLKYAYHDGSSWHTEIVDSAGTVGLYTSLALDTAGYPHISYYNDSNNNLKYTHHDGTTWQVETVDWGLQIMGDAGGHTSLALDDTGHPHISYYDYAHGDLKYAREQEEPPPPPSSRPIILVHGWKGLGKTRKCSEGIGRLGDPGVIDDTFGAMAQWFQEAGYDVWIAHLDTGPLYTPSIEENAQCLREQIDYVRQDTRRRVIVIAHSMGGVVSRACLSFDDCWDNVAALYTLGSPHAGINTGLLIKLLLLHYSPITENLYCHLQPGLCQLTTESMHWFNLWNPNPEATDYHFIGGFRTPPNSGQLLLPFDGPNDGCVGASSAVGQLYPSREDVIRGRDPGRYWTYETHGSGFEQPSYFDAPGGSGHSQAFLCIDSLLDDESELVGCIDPVTSSLSAAAPEPALSELTVDIAGHLSNEQRANHTLQVDVNEHSLFYLSWFTGTLAFTLTQPDGQVVTPAYAEAHPDVVTYTSSLGGDTIPPHTAYAFTTTVPGIYTVTIGAGDVGSDGTDYLLFAALETSRTFSITASAFLHQIGEEAVFTGTLLGPAGGIAGADVQVRFTQIDGVTETLAFADMGGGSYRATYTIPDAPGYVQATFTATGDDSGVSFTRQLDKLLTIAPRTAQLAGTYTDRPKDRDDDGYDDALALDVGLVATQPGTFTLAADLLGGGQTIAHAMQYAIVDSGAQTVTLYFNGQGIRQAHVDGPYTVTQVYLVDVGAGGIPVQTADDVWATAAYHWWEFGLDRRHLPLVLKCE